MADGLSWKEIELHVDNLVPGVLLSGEFLAIGIRVPEGLHRSAFISAAVFVAASYALGLIAALISRNILDSLSERWLRAWVFERFVHGKRTDLLAHYRERDKNKLGLDLERDTYRPTHVREWNVIYRSALRLVPDAKRPEIDRRRAQGRLTRNLLFPIVLGAGIVVRGFEAPLWFAFVATIPAGILAAYLYSYAELNNMAEAHDITAALGAEKPPV